MKLKIKKQLMEEELITYASDHIDLPENGVDCSEGCNPYGFPAKVEEVYKSFDIGRLGPYPHSQALYEAIHNYWKDVIDVEKDNIALADGSINALYIINNIFDTHDTKVLGISPQFTDYYMHAKMTGLEYVPITLRKEDNYKLNVDEFLDESITEDYNYLYIDNPNNPTGQSVSIEDIERIVAKCLKHDIVVIVDEAYGDFMPKSNSAVALFAKYPNLIVVRTLSKGFGLAGLRAGYIIAHKDMIAYMKKMINPYMIGELHRELAAAALSCDDHIEMSMQAFAEMKRQLAEALDGDGRLHMAESLDTCSLCLLYHDEPSIRLKDEFVKRGILVIDGNDFRGLDASSVRLRLPRKEEFGRVLEAVKEINRI